MADASVRDKDMKGGKTNEESINNEEQEMQQYESPPESHRLDKAVAYKRLPTMPSALLARQASPYHEYTPEGDWMELDEPSTSAYTLEEQQGNNFVVVDDPTRFFVVGRVFKTLWSEPAGTTAKDIEEPFYNEIRGYSELSFTKERRFVVVRKRLHSSLCVAIFTYGGQGTTKDHIRSQDHALVFDASRTEPHPWPEEDSDKQSLPIIIENINEQIDPMSRLDFSRIYTVEHNVKVSKLGRISPEYLPFLEDYFVASILGDQAKNDVASTFSGSESGIGGSNLYDDKHTDATHSMPQVDTTVSGPNRYIKGTPGHTEKLDKSYQVRNRDWKTFFRVGRVFSTLWTEGVGIDTGRIDPTFVSEVIYQEKVHSKVRRFLVVRDGDRACTCLPVTSYDGWGAKKRGITLGDHGFIYSQKAPAQVAGMLPMPLKLKLSPSSSFADPSLVNFGKVYTVETNVKVKGIGEIDNKSKSILQKNFQRVFFRSNDSTSSDAGELTGVGLQFLRQRPSISDESYTTSMSGSSYGLSAARGREMSDNQNVYSDAYSTESSYTYPANNNVHGFDASRGLNYNNTVSLDRQLQRKPSCPICWSTRHQCIRDPDTGACTHCKKHNAGVIDEAIALAQPFSTTDAHYQIYKGAPRGSLLSLDTAYGNSSNLGIHVAISQNRHKNESKEEISHHKICIYGSFDLGNDTLVFQLDDMIRDTFAVKLSPKHGTSPTIGSAILAGGYLHLLCSTIGIAEETNTWQDITLVDKSTFGNLGSHLKDIVLSRLKILVQEVLDAVRYIHSLHDDYPQLCSERYAAAAILRHEMFYFSDRLRCGTLALEHHLPPDFKLLLVEWFISVERELASRIQLYCGRFPDWQTAIKGPLKNSRRQGETINLALRLDNFHVSSPLTSQDGQETSDVPSSYLAISPGWLS